MNRALVIDDDPNAIDAIAETMSSLDHDFDTACSQSEAVRRVQLCTYSYIVLDIMIPARTRTGRPRIQNTENFLERLAKICGDNMPPVIITSDLKADNAALAVEMMRLAADLFAKGTTTFIEKPFPTAGRTLDRVIKKVQGKKPIRVPVRRTKAPAQPPTAGMKDTDCVRKRKARRHETPPQTPPVQASSTAGTVLTIPERDILQGMVEARGETMLQVDVMAAAGYGKHATSTALKRLRELALVCQPHGLRKGNALTDKGRALVASWGCEGKE